MFELEAEADDGVVLVGVLGAVVLVEGVSRADVCRCRGLPADAILVGVEGVLTLLLLLANVFSIRNWLRPAAAAERFAASLLLMVDCYKEKMLINEQF